MASGTLSGKSVSFRLQTEVNDHHFSKAEKALNALHNFGFKNRMVHINCGLKIKFSLKFNFKLSFSGSDWSAKTKLSMRSL